MKRSFELVAAKTAEEVVRQRLDGIRAKPQEHAHDQAGFTHGSSIDGEIRIALAEAQWQHIT